jgi:hypothetical protein
MCIGIGVVRIELNDSLLSRQRQIVPCYRSEKATSYSGGEKDFATALILVRQEGIGGKENR